VDKNLIKKSVSFVQRSGDVLISFGGGYLAGRHGFTCALIEPFILGVEGGDADVYYFYFSDGPVAAAGLDEDPPL